MNKTPEQKYEVWRGIDYEPALSEMLPKKLLPHLEGGQRVLEAGCNKGQVSVFLAQKGLSVIGVDINDQAIKEAADLAKGLGVEDRVRFLKVDFLTRHPLDSFDAVLMIRFLTCLPLFEDWCMALSKCQAALAPGGWVYIHDFVFDPANAAYQARYAIGEANGWRKGNFPVFDRAGHPLFVAHHHTETELGEIMDRFDPVHQSRHRSLSMNGNPCMMFEFIGRKKIDVTTTTTGTP
jgi:SAM-dependent methyltransferase